MKNIACVYTAGALVEPLKAEFNAAFPEVRLTTLVDETLIHDIIHAGSITPALEQRFMALLQAAQATACDAIFCTCSSVGELVDKAKEQQQTPIIKIDKFMIRQAVTECERLAIIATLNTTLEPTLRLVQKAADEAGRSVVLEKGLAKGAFEAVVRGDTTTHDRLIMETSHQLQDHVDGMILAQGSMARFAAPLAAATGKKVYASVKSGVAGLKHFLATR